MINTQHTQGRVTFREDGDANHWSMLTEDGKWMLALLHNGEQTTPQQVANFRRMAACWNACEGTSTEWLESQSTVVLLGPPIADLFKKLTAERDTLLAAAKAALAALAGEDEPQAVELDILESTLAHAIKAATGEPADLEAPSPIAVMHQALTQIAAGSDHTGRWLDESGTECHEGDDGARWVEFTADEQLAWLDSVAAIAADALKAVTPTK